MPGLVLDNGSIIFYIEDDLYLFGPMTTLTDTMAPRPNTSGAGACTRAAASPMEDETRLVDQLKALAHPVRFRMVQLAHESGGDICACAFEPHFDLTQPTISHHLKVLREAGLLRSWQEGPWVHHAIEPATFERLRALMGRFVSPPGGR